MNKLIKKLEKNKNIESLLNEFINDFTRNYEDSDDVEGFIMRNYRDTIFRQWLFSPIVEDTYLTPHYIINNIAQDIEKGDYSIAPHIDISIVNNEVSFKTRWIKYSSEELPVLDDLEILVKYCNPTLIQRENNMFVLDNGQRIIDKINFRSGYYIEYLIELALRLNIIEEIKAIGCKCYKVSEGYYEYENLENTEKVKKILKKSIELSNENLERDCGINNSNIATEFLDNNINCDEFDKYMVKLVKHYENLTNDLKNLDLNKEEMMAIKEIERLTDDDISNIMAAKEFEVFFDINFTNVFGYYLGMIMPIYDNLFFVDVFNKIASKLIQEEAIINLIFPLELGHDLTPFGDKVVNEIKNKLREKIFKNNNSGLINEAVEYYLNTKYDALEEYMGMFEIEDDNDDFDFFDDDDEMLAELFGENMSKAIIKHLTDFYDYLFVNRGLKEKTANKHCENVEFYLSNYLNMKELDELNKITKDSLHNFIIEWFIPKVATSRSNVKDEIISLNQYLKFLVVEGFVKKELLDDFKEISKNKDNYLYYFDEYMDDEWDIF